jgi:peptide deformylase
VLRKLPDPILRKKAVPVTTKLDLSSITEEMSRVRQENGGIGLAAPQIGQSIRIINIVYRGKEYTIFNPYIKHKKGAVKMFEGCLSVPDIYRVTRPQTLTLFGEDAHGRPIKLKCKTYEEAAVAEHEVDHLDGILIDKKGEFCSHKADYYEEKGKLTFG